MRLIVAGPRDYDGPAEIVLNELESTLESTDELTVVHGACPKGVDVLVNEWALAVRADFPDDIGIEPYPAENFGSWPECGPLRNRHMAELGADLCLTFGALCNRERCGRPKPHMTHGTASMVNEALRNDIEIRIVPL